MSQAKTAFVLLVVFFAGCAASQVVARAWVPPARADTNPQRWEYSCVTVHSESELYRIANKFGAEGWEMSGVAMSEWCFKRPLP